MADEVYEDGDYEQVLFQGPMFGREANLKKNPRLVQAGLVTVKEIISDALARRAHLIVVEPKGPRQIVRVVIDGIPYVVSQLPGKKGIAVIQMVKLLAGLDVQSRVATQKGGILASYDDEQYRLLIETSPIKSAVERLKIRIQNVKDVWNTPGEIDFPQDLRESIQNITEDANGVLLSCGLPESGVTSLSQVLMHCMDSYLYSLYNVADTGEQKLINVSEVNDEGGIDLELKLDRILRQEGDAVYVGKIEDAKTADLLFEYSTKLCLIGEIEAKTPAEAVKKLMDWVGLEKVLPSLKAVFAQKLIRRLCDDCKQAFRPDATMLRRLGLPRETTVLYRPPPQPDPEDPDAPTVEELCAPCNGVPYHGRAPAYEVFEMTDTMREVVATNATSIEIRRQMIKEKQRMLQQDALRLVLKGMTSLDELKRTFRAPKGRGGASAKRRPRP